jgi:hypothetical protein
MLAIVTRTLVLSLLLMWMFTSEDSCCDRRNKGRIPGRLEAYVVLGTGRPPKCVKANPEQSPREGKVNVDIPLWLRAVFYDDLNKPINGRQIFLDVIDPLGDAPSADQHITITPPVAITDQRGFNETVITVRSSTPGVYRVRATYEDKKTKAVSYSPPLLIK